MPGLLDHIFDNVDIEKLNRKEIMSYTAYISEISQQNLPLDKKLKFLTIQIRLQRRLLNLDADQFKLDKELLYTLK
ncbi:hypothetical protein AHMF7605_00470 [Adhaeribacter arboris]|uniref:Uncharacterized protein n=1 Tax=Adhaeribacter arboris TaxID=2072846 RepID=A0A2T2Y996_9BACT|nr:hypothetical protein [Adhaeribacter arboris]PSR52099.1 hypothetical protein AHMF7605_00470 [Adhaeribacter arboris]